MMNDQADNMTETRGSIEESPSFWTKLKSYICPCILPPPNITISMHLQKQDMQSISKASETNRSSNPYKQKNTVEVQDNINFRRSGRHPRRGSEEIGQFQLSKREALLNKKSGRYDRQFRQTLNLENGYNLRRTYDEQDCSICSLTENELLSMGINDRHLLVKITTANISANLSLLKRELQSPRRKKDKQDNNQYHEYEFNKFWGQRYALFQKFDEGIKVDESSWARIPPEQISDFIANKCNGAKIILQGFAGVGGTTIKLANINSCVKIIANDKDEQKTKFLLNNAKVYEVDSCIELSETDFLEVQSKNVDLVYVQPPLGKLQIDGHRSISIVDFEPTLDKIIMKSLKLAPNLMMLLPPSISVDVLCSCLNKCASELKKMRQFCSIHIEKIYYENQFKYILISMGKLIQNEIKLNDELGYIYTRLKKAHEKFFRHKKIIKKIREDHGMLQLFNLLKESEKKCKDKSKMNTIIGKQDYVIDSFYEIIQQKNLLPKEKIAKIILEQNQQFNKRESLLNSLHKIEQPDISMSSVMQQEKVEENDLAFRQSEQTQSEYSHYSYLSGLDKNSANPSHGSRPVRLQSDSFSSVIIKRTMNGSKQKRDISPNSKNGSPVTPSRRAGRNRITQILEKRQAEGTKKKTTQQHM